MTIECDDNDCDKTKSKDTQNSINLPKKEVSLGNIINSIAEYTHLAPEKITPDSKLVNDLGMDSLEIMDLFLDLMQGYGININNLGYTLNAKPTVQDFFIYFEKSLSSSEKD